MQVTRNHLRVLSGQPGDEGMVLEEVKGESRSSKRLPWLSDGDSSPADSVRQGMTTNLSVPQPAETEAVVLFGLFGSTSCCDASHYCVFGDGEFFRRDCTRYLPA